MKTPSVRSATAPSVLRSLFPLSSTLLKTVAIFAGATALSGAEPAPAADKVAVPVISSDETVKKNLVELDRLLDVPGSKLEEVLRKNIDHIQEDSAPKNVPELEGVLKEQPWIVPTLKAERHFLLHRYLARRARGPLLRPDLIALDKFLSEHLDIRRALDRDPSQVVQSDFLVAHPSLGEFFSQHPSLSTVLLIPQGPPPGRRPEPKSK